MTTPVVAANASLPIVTVSSGNPVLGNSGVTVTFTLSNPTGNQFTVTGFTILAPSGWDIVDCNEGGFLSTCTVSATGSSVTFSVAQFFIGTAAGVPPGGDDLFSFSATSPTASTTYPFTSGFTSKVQDASAVSFYNGPSFNLVVMDPTTGIAVSVTPAGSNTVTSYTAGTAPYTATATVTCTVSSTCPSGFEAGLPVVWTDTGTGKTATYPSSFSPASGPTGSAGTQISTFQPSDTAGKTGVPTATIGTSAVTNFAPNTITTYAGSPSAISFTFTNFASDNNHYETAEGTTTHNSAAYPSGFTGAKTLPAEISFSIADKFGNPQAFNNILLTAYTITLTAVSGGGLFDALTLPSAITCAKGADWFAGATDLLVACPAAGSSAAIPFNYYQSTVWGSIGELSATVSGTYATASFSGSGTSNEVITSTFALVSPTPAVNAPTGVTLPWVPAGDKVNVTASVAALSTCGAGAALCPTQQGVPVSIFLNQVTSYETKPGAMDYGAHSVLTSGFSNGAFDTNTLQLHTNSAGQVSALFTLDTVACEDQANACTTIPNAFGSHAFYFSNVTAPTDTSLTATLGQGADSANVITIAGTPASFALNAYFDYITTPPPGALDEKTTTAATSTSFKDSLFLDVVISDKYGNLAFNPGPSNLQVNLVATGGLLTASSVYIPASCSDTAGTTTACTTPFGPIQWTMPSSTGTITLTATGVISGNTITNHTSISVVSPLPTFAITSPTAGVNNVIYGKSTTVVFHGQANVSLGYDFTTSTEAWSAADPDVYIASVTYSIDGAHAQSAVITALTGQVVFSVAALITNGLHTVQFNATDSNGNTVVGSKYSVLADTSAPTVAFITKAKAEVNSSNPLTFTVTDPEGDLGWATVSYNGTALTQSLIAVTPSVNSSSTLGKATTYTVTARLPSGRWSVTVGAKDLAGNTAPTATEIVTAVLATDLSFTATQITQQSFAGQPAIEATVTNNLPTAFSAIVYATISGSGNIPTATINGLASGGSSQIFLSLAGLAPGTYTVTFVVYSTLGVPLSVPYTTSVTIS